MLAETVYVKILLAHETRSKVASFFYWRQFSRKQNGNCDWPQAVRLRFPCLRGNTPSRLFLDILGTFKVEILDNAYCFVSLLIGYFFLPAGWFGELLQSQPQTIEVQRIYVGDHYITSVNTNVTQNIRM